MGTRGSVATGIRSAHDGHGAVDTGRVPLMLAHAGLDRGITAVATTAATGGAKQVLLARFVGRNFASDWAGETACPTSTQCACMPGHGGVQVTDKGGMCTHRWGGADGFEELAKFLCGMLCLWPGMTLSSRMIGQAKTPAPPKPRRKRVNPARSTLMRDCHYTCWYWHSKGGAGDSACPITSELRNLPQSVLRISQLNCAAAALVMSPIMRLWTDR